MKQKRSYNIAVIGGGAIGIYHIEGFRAHSSARVVALAETHAERGLEIAKRFSIPDVYPDYKDVLRRADIDIVSIALPNYLHAPVALAALKAGKHVMLDKPMATNARDAAKLVAEAKSQKVLFMVGQNQRFSREVQTLKGLVNRGVLGDVYHAKAKWLRRAGIPRIGSWFTQRKYSGGGCTYDIGVHVLDQTLFLMGEFDAAAVSAQTYAKFGPLGKGDGSWGKSEIDPRKPFDVDDFSVALIKMKSGRTVLLEASWASHQAERDVNGTQLFGTEAGATTHPLQLFRSGPKGYIVESLDLQPPAVNPDRMAHFIEVLQGNEKLFVQPTQSLAVQRILDAIYRSAATGREIRI